MFQNFVTSLVVIIESEPKPTGLFRVPCWIQGPHGLRFQIFQKSTGNTGRFQRLPLFSSRDRMFQMSVHGVCQQCDHSRPGLLVCCLRKLCSQAEPRQALCRQDLAGVAGFRLNQLPCVQRETYGRFQRNTHFVILNKREGEKGKGQRKRGEG